MERSPICRGRDSISISVHLRFYADTNLRNMGFVEYELYLAIVFSQTE